MRVGHLPAATGPTARQREEDPGDSAAATARAERQAARPTASTTVAGPLVLDRYRLHRRLGTGGFGTVWMARDERLERDVAVKILPRERVVGGRFEREARAAAALSHPGIVTLYEAAADDEGAYLVSELVRGSTLGRALQSGRLSDRGILTIGIALCDALEHAHAHGIVHRDVKPSNILIPTRTTTPEQAAKLTDFGVARVLGGDTLTRTGELVGTVAYMAPEQAEGREAGAAADLYSLALVLYEALSGVNPAPAGRGEVPRARRLAVHLPPLRRQRRDLPHELGQAIDQALRPRPRERGTLDELRDGLELARAQVEDVRGVVGAPPLTRTARSTRPEPDALRKESRRDAAAIEPARAAGLPVRALGAALTGLLAIWVDGRLIHPTPMPAAAAALLAGLVAIVLPRLAWLGLVASATTTLAVGGDSGTALVLGAALLIPVALLPRARGHWPLPAAAPLLALIGLAGAWPALAARAGGPYRRAALGALGWVCLYPAGALAGRAALYVHLPSALPARTVWAGSPYEAVHHVLGTLLTPDLLAGALVWALAAVALPAVPARRPRSAVLLGAGWSAALTMATVVALHAVGSAHAVPGTGALLLGSLAAALVVLAPYGAPRQWRSRGAGARLA